MWADLRDVCCTRHKLSFHLLPGLFIAARAKAATTTATVIESSTDKLIRELREENARLTQMLKSGGVFMAACEEMSRDGKLFHAHPVCEYLTVNF